jgi:Flp pilus assembly secretin CpaC
LLHGQTSVRRLLTAALSLVAVLVLPVAARAQSELTRVTLSVGRSLPVQSPGAVSRVTVANPEIADVVVVGEREVVINGRRRARPTC